MHIYIFSFYLERAFQDKENREAPACFSIPKKDRERDSLLWEGEP